MFSTYKKLIELSEKLSAVETNRQLGGKEYTIDELDRAHEMIIE